LIRPNDDRPSHEPTPADNSRQQSTPAEEIPMNRPVCFSIAAGVIAAALAPTVVDARVGDPGMMTSAASPLGISTLDTPWRRALDAAIEPDPECDDSTPLVEWMRSLIAPIAPETLDLLVGYDVGSWSFAWTIVGDQDASDESLGLDGELTKKLQRRHRSNQTFWDVPTDDVLLQGAHGAVLAEDADIVPVLATWFAVDASIAQVVVDTVQAAIEADPAVGYDHPMLTFNAFAFSGEIPGAGPISDKIVVGDGALRALEAIGLGDVGPAFLHAHEFAHHVQAEVGVFDGYVASPEGTRRTELMADAFAAYDLAHVRGATFRTKRLADAATAAWNIGDCEFDSPNHHGTPDQRRSAVAWGVAQATDPRPTSGMIPATALVDEFDTALISLLEP
jgi:hypothetical protein